MIVGTLGIKRIKFIFISCIKSWEGGKNEFQVKGMCKRFLGGEYKNFQFQDFLGKNILASIFGGGLSEVGTFWGIQNNAKISSKEFLPCIVPE